MDHIKKLFDFHTNITTTLELPQLPAMNHNQKAAELPGNAAEKVFGIAELAEMILLGVDDVTTLVPARRVNKRFNEVIAHDMQQSKQKYWLGCDVSQLPMRWYEDTDCASPYPQAQPHEIELNPWAVKGCIPKMSLQYKNHSVVTHGLPFRAPVVMTIRPDILDDGWVVWWHGMEILRLKEQKRDMRIIVIVEDYGSPARTYDLYKALMSDNLFDISLADLEKEEHTLKGMLELVFQYWRVAQRCRAESASGQ